MQNYNCNAIFLLFDNGELAHAIVKQQKKTTAQSSLILLLRRALDSNQRIPYDIGSLANCWFKPLTQPSVVFSMSEKRCKYTTYFGLSKIFHIFYLKTHSSYPDGGGQLKGYLLLEIGQTVGKRLVVAAPNGLKELICFSLSPLGDYTIWVGEYIAILVP